MQGGGLWEEAVSGKATQGEIHALVALGEPQHEGEHPDVPPLSLDFKPYNTRSFFKSLSPMS